MALALAGVEGAARGGLAEHAQRGDLVPALPSLSGDRQRPLGGGRSFADAISEEARLAK